MSKINLPPARKESPTPAATTTPEAPKAPEEKAPEVKSPVRTGKVVKVVATKYPMSTPGGHHIPTNTGVEIPLSGWVESQITARLLKEV